jgi:hypothetical protein
MHDEVAPYEESVASRSVDDDLNGDADDEVAETGDIEHTFPPEPSSDAAVVWGDTYDPGR